MAWPDCTPPLPSGHGGGKWPILPFWVSHVELGRISNSTCDTYQPPTPFAFFWLVEVTANDEDRLASHPIGPQGVQSRTVSHVELGRCRS